MTRSAGILVALVSAVLTQAALAAACLPPGVPDLSALHPSPINVSVVQGPGETDFYAVIDRFYDDDAGHTWHVVTMLGSVVAVDDHVSDAAATDWYVDGGMVTDDRPMRAQATPTPTCQFHRRLDKSLDKKLDRL